MLRSLLYDHDLADHYCPFKYAFPLGCEVFVSHLPLAEFLDAIRAVKPAGRWKVLVVDEHSQKLLGSVLKQFDILEENVTGVSALFMLFVRVLTNSLK